VTVAPSEINLDSSCLNFCMFAVFLDVLGVPDYGLFNQLFNPSHFRD
jgi:hypothetical protein